jgi:hypothetical protein
MKPRLPIAILGMAALVVSCSKSPDNQAQAPVGQSANGVVAQAPAQPANPQSFPNPVASPTALVGARAVPGLLQPTNAKARIPTIATGRRDPFAALMMPPMAVSVERKASLSASSPGSLPRLKPAPLPNFPARSNSTPLPPVSVSVAPRPGAFPTVPIPAAPPSQTSQAEAIEISGALQVGGTWTIIVKEPGSPTSRYVRTGEYLANGQVLVKRIIAGADPVVVLQQNGVELTKVVGSSNGPIARR